VTTNLNAEAVRPLRRKDVLAAAALDELVLYDPQSNEAMGLNVSGSALWSLCDGTRSVDEILPELAEMFDSRPDDIRGDVERILEELCARGVLTLASAGADE
jgi:hypothetical protein